MIEVGKRVEVTCDGGFFALKGATGIITHISPDAQHMLPIQVTLDQPYDDTGQTILRFKPREVKVIE